MTHSAIQGLLRCLLAALVAMLCACALPTKPQLPAELLQDALFAPPEALPDRNSVFALSPAMKLYAETKLRLAGPAGHSAGHGDLRHELLDALYARAGLRLDYDASITRNAAEAFEARAGNCLSLVIMTASFARHFGLPVTFQQVSTEDFYTRSGTLTLANTHVNLVLGALPTRSAFRVLGATDEALLIDFIPARDLRGQVSVTLAERTVLAMYFNNRAAEELKVGRLNNAYWFARASLLEDFAYAAAANTLGVIYERAGNDAAAETSLRHALALAPRNVSSLNNLANLLARQGRTDEAMPLRALLAQLEPTPPFQRYYEGRQAMAEGRYAQARDLFRQELRLQPFQDEVHFWAAQAAWQLGRRDEALLHLRHAADNSVSRSDQERYSAKLEHLRNAAQAQ